MSDRMTLIGLAFGVFMLTATGFGFIVYEAESHEAKVQTTSSDEADR